MCVFFRMSDWECQVDDEAEGYHGGKTPIVSAAWLEKQFQVSRYIGRLTVLR